MSALSIDQHFNFISMYLFNFQSSNFPISILEYHSGNMAVKILHKLFSIPYGQGFYSLILKLGGRILSPTQDRKSVV